MHKFMDLKNNWSILTQNRNAIYGLAIISIIIFHFFENYLSNINYGLIHICGKLYNMIIGSIGVEIFIILSGIGLYFSLSKNKNIKEFYIKRIRRIAFPSVVIMVLFWMIKDFFIEKSTIIVFIKDLFFVSFFENGDRTFWFVLFITVAYAIYPLVFKIINKKSWLNKLAILLITFIIQIVPYIFFKKIYSNVEIMLCRFFPLIIGAFIGKNVYNQQKINKYEYTIILTIFVISMLLKIGVIPNYFYNISNRNINALYALSVIFAISYILITIKNTAIINILNYIGKYSFEIYLTHVAIRELFNTIGLYTYNITNYTLCLILACITIIILEYFKKKVMNVEEKYIRR